MQVFGNVATDPVRKVSKTTGKGYYEFRLCENSRGNQAEKKAPTWYSVRVMKDANPGLERGAFARVTGSLKVDSYLSREGKPTSTLIIISFEAVQLKSVDQLRDAREAKQQEEGQKESAAA